MLKKRREKTPEQALASMMKLCSKAEKSSGDARRLMRLWGVGPEDIEKVLQKLIDQRFIDDERYTSAYVREKTGFSGWGAYKIRNFLNAKGIAREIVDAALADLDPEAMDERLDKVLAKKKKSIKLVLTPYEMRSKLTTYALSQGYDYGSVVRAVDRLLKGDSDLRRPRKDTLEDRRESLKNWAR